MIYFCSIIFSTTAVAVVVVLSSILMMLLTWAFGKEPMHQKSLAAAWIFFLLFICLGLSYMRYSYAKVVNTHTKVYQDIFQHCAQTIQNKKQAAQQAKLSKQSELYLWLQQHLQKSETNKDIIASIYLIKQQEKQPKKQQENQQEKEPHQTFTFLNLTTPLDEQKETTTDIESSAGLAVWQNIPLKQIFGQNHLPQPIADAFDRQAIVIDIIKRTDYQENRLIFATPIMGRDNTVLSVLCLEIKEKDWLKELLFARILPHSFFFSFLFFFFAMQIILIRRRIIVKHLKEHRITSYEQALDHLIAVKTSAEEKSIDRNYLIRQVDLEFKKPLIPILESSFLLRRQIQAAPDSLFELESQQATLALFEKMFWGCKKLKLVLSDIRTFIDLEWNQIDVQTVMFSPQQIIHDLRNICQQHFLEKPNIKFRIDTISAIPDLVRGDQQKIQRVLEELLEMAIDRVVTGHIKITCYMSGSQLCWIILDTGETLTENQTRQLNEFYSGEWTRHVGTDGKMMFNFDFGSSIAAAFTYLLKGNVSFQSNTGHGNKCTTVFPVEI
ncbi:MAG: hypothetical protein LBP59_12145 [Planctomycetaceae bacterium]|jgi:signal transduction histidine kinase|nr:hypothetical protein [Planctomycetaceae bacterium]